MLTKEDAWFYCYLKMQADKVERDYNGIPPGLPWNEYWRAG